VHDAGQFPVRLSMAKSSSGCSPSLLGDLVTLQLNWQSRLVVMTVNNHPASWSQSSKPAWTQLWHVWTVIIPRRSITGRLVHGRVWRRHDGRRWVYKAFVDADQDRI
jgi:hypothetical protein